MVTELEFFKGKRTWSKIKDKVIGNYLVPYFEKISKLKHRIIIVDVFAGQGIFEDGEKGSPLIICETAEKHVPNQYLAIFVNKDKVSHQKLEMALKGYVKRRKAIPILGSSQDLLKELSHVVGEATLLIYLDPFGLKGCEFDLLKPYLGRNRRFSTEVIINMSVPTLHRLCTFKAVKEKRVTNQTKKLNQRLTEIFDGDYWQEIMWSDLPSADKEQQLVERYVDILKKYLPYAGFCPVREMRGKRVKYYIIFCSRHKDALLLMNDIMCKAYFKTIHEIEYKGTLFEGMLDWRKMQQRGDIKKEISQIIKTKPGVTRKDLWLEIIKNHFMKWMRSEFIEAVDEMSKGDVIRFVSTTSRLNDDSRLYLLGNSSPMSFCLSPVPRNLTPKVHYSEYSLLNGKKKRLVKKINDGSIITRFNKTPLPQKPTDVVCPHFLELKWAYGCPFDCAWCYLKGTFRFRPEGIRPNFKSLDKVKSHVDAFLNEVDTPEILNTGEIADSLMGEKENHPFSKFIISLFERQNRHRVLFVTKSANVKHLLEIPASNQVVISFSINAEEVAKKWEKKAPPVKSRIEAARKLYKHGYEVRVRVDPMVPVKNWEKYYTNLVDLLFDSFVPERITLGSLRGLQSTINGVKDNSWVKYLSESSNWGKKIDINLRVAMYKTIISYLLEKYNYSNVALCKETKAVWKILKLDYKKNKCNCVW